MFSLTRTGACVALAAGLLATAEPALAACRIEGDAYRVINNHPGDPTGPSVFIKESPGDAHSYFVRLRDGWRLFRTLERTEPVRISVQGDVPSCPATGPLRDLGTAVGGVTLLQTADTEHLPARPAP